ncbi:class I SAM-dependent methyltransferase [Nakamurella alba]|uniref:class I SAM-dependent methyltransferase n=1 Tax=Nakamurella alba TaxID=2665158 RepID=UPI002AC335E1|nr:class I SAM-dependent methyltransferase [Nakamurella alba]
MAGLAYRVKSTYAGAVRATGRVLTAVHVLPKEAPPREKRVRHWFHSLFQVHDSLAIARLGVPWWTYDAIDKVDAWLKDRARPIRVFEYGSGASTIWLSARADEVHTVEHHKGFADHIGPKLATFPNISMMVVEPVESPLPAVPSEKSGNRGLDFSDYVAAIDKVGGTFDVVVVDGRVRAACLKAAIPHLAEDGMVIFDNSRRRRYRTAIETSGLTELKLSGLTPTLPYPDQTSLLAHAK